MVKTLIGMNVLISNLKIRVVISFGSILKMIGSKSRSFCYICLCDTFETRECHPYSRKQGQGLAFEVNIQLSMKINYYKDSAFCGGVIVC